MMDINGNIPDDILDKTVTTGNTNLDVNQTSPSDSTLIVKPTTVSSFPLIKRPSGLLPRQNSGINSILDTDLASDASKTDGVSTNTMQNPGTGQIRTSYEQPSVTPRVQISSQQSKHQPLRLSNIFQQQMRRGSPGGRTSTTPVLSKAFFDSIRDQVRTIKSTTESHESETIFGPLHLETTNSIQPLTPSVCTLKLANASASKEIRINETDCTNLNINFTVNLSQFDGKSADGFDLRDARLSKVEVRASMDRRSSENNFVEASSLPYKNCGNVGDVNILQLSDGANTLQSYSTTGDKGRYLNSVLSAELMFEDHEQPELSRSRSTHDMSMMNTISRRPGRRNRDTQQEILPQYSDNTDLLSSPKASSSVVTHPTPDIEIKGNATESDLVEKSMASEYFLSAITQVLEMTGGSMKTAASLLTNIVPMDDTECDEEEMNACEGDLPIKFMRILGVPKSTRHNIYNEISGEVEVLQDLGTGTYDALTTILRWVCGGREGREDFLAATRTLCSVHTEVDSDSEVWNRMNKKVVVLTDVVDGAIQGSVNTAEVVGDSIVDFVTSMGTSAATQNLNNVQSCVNIEEKKHEGQCDKIEEQIEDGKVSNVDAQNQSAVESVHNFPNSSSSLHFFPSFEESIPQTNIEHETVKRVNSKHARIEPSSLSSSVKLEDRAGYDSTSFLNPEIFGQQLNSTNDYFPMSEVNFSQGKNSNNPVGDGESHLVSPGEREQESCTIDELMKEFGKPQDDIQGPDDNNNSLWPSLSSEIPRPLVVQRAQRILSNLEDMIVTSSSAQLLNKLPRPPPNSEPTFDKAKHNDKVIQDMKEVSKLVKELYESMSQPNPSQTHPPNVPLQNKLITNRIASKLELLPSRIPIPNVCQQLSGVAVRPSPTFIFSQSSNPQNLSISNNHTSSRPRPPSRNSMHTTKCPTVSLYHSPMARATDSEGSFIQCSAANSTYNKMRRYEPELVSSCTSVYSNNSDVDQASTVPLVGSATSRCFSRSFLSPTISSANKAKLRLHQKLSTTTVGSFASSARISTTSDTSITNDANWARQKPSASSVDSNVTWLREEGTENEQDSVSYDNKPQVEHVPCNTYQQLFQKKNSSIVKHFMKPIRLDRDQISNSSVSTTASSKPRFRF